MTDLSPRFKWVELQLNYLCTLKTRKLLEERLGKLPKHLRELYEELYAHHMLQQDETEQLLTQSVFAWLLVAGRHLNSSAFIQLVSAPTQDPQDVPTKETILDLCFNLVTYDSSLDTFAFTHLSVREFLENRTDFNQRLVHDIALRSCLDIYDYCSEHADATKVVNVPDRPGWIPLQDWFVDDTGGSFMSALQYALDHWTNHLVHVLPLDDELISHSRLRDFLQPDARPFRVWSKMNILNAGVSSKHYNLIALPPNPLFIICEFDLCQYLQEALEKTSALGLIDQTSMEGKCAALYSKRLSVLQAFLDQGALVDCSRKDFERVLMLAVRSGWFTAVWSFVGSEKYKKHVTTEQAYVLALKAAARYHAIKVAQVCIEHLKIAATDDTWKDVALFEGSYHGSEDIVQLLLQETIDEVYKWSWNVALIYAVRMKRDAIIEKLIDIGADINVGNTNKYVPLTENSPLADNIEGDSYSTSLYLMLKKAIQIDQTALETLFKPQLRSGKNSPFISNFRLLGDFETAIFVNGTLYLMFQEDVALAEDRLRFHHHNNLSEEQDLSNVREEVARWLNRSLCLQRSKLHLLFEATAVSNLSEPSEEPLTLVAGWTVGKENRTLSLPCKVAPAKIDRALIAFADLAKTDEKGQRYRRILENVLHPPQALVSLASLSSQTFKTNLLRCFSDHRRPKYNQRDSVRSEILYDTMKEKLSGWRDLGRLQGG